MRRPGRPDDVEVLNRDPRDYGGRARSAVVRLRRDGPVELLRHALGLVRREIQLRRYRWTPRRLVRPLDSIPIDRPVFLLGVPGGGGTLTSRALLRHPATVYATGNSDYWGGEAEIHNRPHLDLPDRFVLRSAHFHNLDESVEWHPVFGYQRSPFYATDELLPRYRMTGEDVTPELADGFRRVVRGLIRAYAHDPGRARFVDMSQLFTVQVSALRRILSDASPDFVILARNPYTWCLRTVEKAMSGFGTTTELSREQKVRFAVECWDNSYRLARGDAASGRLHLLRYEDFLADPEREVRALCDFLGLPFEPTQIPGPGQRLPAGSHSPRKWYPLQTEPPAEGLLRDHGDVVEAVNRRCADLVGELGYDKL